MKAIITTYHNGDELKIEIPETGEVFTRFFGHKTATSITVNTYNHDRVWQIVNRRAITKKFGGNPYPGAPHWASDFCASGEADLPEQDVEYLRWLKKLTQESEDPHAVLREIYLREIGVRA